MKNETKVDKTKTPPEDALETPSSDTQVVEPAPVDAKTLARQRSKDDLARKRRDMHQKRGKR
jgi:hypothetical protein